MCYFHIVHGIWYDATDVFYFLEPQVTFLLFFPTRLEHTVNEMLATNTRLDTVKHVIVVGGVLSQRLAELTLSAFPNAVSLKNVYGLTEAASCLCAPAGSSSCYTNVGFPFSMVKIKVYVTLLVELFYSIHLRINVRRGGAKYCT